MKTRAYKDLDECLADYKVKCKSRVKCYSGALLLKRKNDGTLYYAITHWTYDDLVFITTLGWRTFSEVCDNFTYTDGTPFGIMVTDGTQTEK